MHMTVMGVMTLECTAVTLMDKGILHTSLMVVSITMMTDPPTDHVYPSKAGVVTGTPPEWTSLLAR